MIPSWVRDTSDDRIAGGIRIMLGVLFVMTGAMKLLVPTLGAAFAGQLAAANLPFQELSRWLVPFTELAVGGVLLVGAFARLAALVVVGIMIVATYVHLQVDDPALFPLQPTEPIIPLVALVMCAWVLWKGAGSWSADLKTSDRS